MKRVRILLIPLLLFFIYLSPIFRNIIQSQDLSDSLPIRINEFMPNPKSYDNDYEWIEIYNTSENEFILYGCNIDNFSITEDLVIQPFEFIIFTRDLNDWDGDGRSFEERYGDNSGLWGDHENEDFQAFEAAFSLSNSGGELLLSCDKGTDKISWADSKEAQSLSANKEGHIVDNYPVTPGKENMKEINITYPESILITEVFPSPDKTKDEQEWLEIYNYGDKQINLTDWYIKDTASKQNFPDDLIVKPETYFIIKGNDLDITLNNSGDEIKLFNPNDKLLSTFIYEKTSTSMSNILEFDGENYQDKITQTQVATPEKKNKYVAINNLFYGKKVILINEAKDILESEVLIEGVITVDIDLLGSKQFYIQDSSGGINVYFSDRRFWKDYQIGDKLRLVGQIKYSREEPKIYVSSTSAIKKIAGNNQIELNKLDTGNVKKSFIGNLFVVKGEIVETSGTTFYIDDGSGEIKVLIKNSINIETPDKKTGQFVQVKGILSVYGSDDQGDLSYRLLPRYAEDILISDVPIKDGEILAVTGENIWMKINVTFLGIITYLFRERIKVFLRKRFFLKK